ncbi:Maltose/maltodextrin ABC transporter, substrate binding periplasmic protein MalE [Pseudoalteromonas luteoviolacea B = ATCC 29581]|nr:Maltose/maltodextrin ABC transporter, substrate binding periplasmic protein MalE [Pseudoalteromonas luteoviolacea B = ATCC 29581]
MLFWLRWILAVLFIAHVVTVQAKTIENKISVAIGVENYNFQPIFDQFTKQTGIKVEILGFENNELKSQLLQKATSSSLPDAVIVPSDFLGLESLDFSTIPDEWLSSELNRDAVASAKHNGEIKGVPFIFGNHLLLYYHKKWVKQPPKNWHEIMALRSSIPINIDLLAWNYFEMYWFAAFYNAHNSPLLKNSQANLNTKEMVQSIKKYKQLRESVNLDRDCDYTCMVNKFENGKVAMAINGSWIFKQWITNKSGEIGVVQLPNIDGMPMRSFYSPHVVAFPNNRINSTQHAKLKALSVFIQSKAVQLQAWNQLSTLPVRQDALDNLAMKENSLKLLISGLEHSKPLPNDMAMAYIWEAMLKGITRFESGIMNAEQAANYMQYIADKSIEHASQKYSD